jgi:hypothetical protein
MIHACCRLPTTETSLTREVGDATQYSSTICSTMAPWPSAVRRPGGQEFRKQLSTSLINDLLSQGILFKVLSGEHDQRRTETAASRLCLSSTCTKADGRVEDLTTSAEYDDLRCAAVAVITALQCYVVWYAG